MFAYNGHLQLNGDIMKLFATIVFFLSFAAWAWMEFIARAYEGPKEILLWVGMGAMMIVNTTSNGRSGSA